MVGPHEPLVADRADEVLLPGVGPGVPGQLVGAGEALPAPGPVARERALACTVGRKDLGCFLFLIWEIQNWLGFFSPNFTIEREGMLGL